ncbi:SCP2 sterol-binding domain-containing protein [Sporichthya brevicatena]|uniref:SCP2 sterol-binding domain-containing protein n=2 Tax=Sporichthya brevicatena TaxID=171442 RepID=A0ABN1GS95_9ACTN
MARYDDAKGSPMAVFKDAEEVYKYIGGAFTAAVNDPKFIEATKGTGLVIRLIQTDPDCEMTIDWEGQKVLTGAAADSVPHNVQLRMSSDNSNRFWQGKLNFTLAMAQRKVKLDGKRSVALKLLPLTGGIFETYLATLQADGRDDLIVS